MTDFVSIMTKIYEKVSTMTGWHALRYFLFSLSNFNFQPSRVKGLKSTSLESEGSSDSNKVNFNPPGLTWAEISALKDEK